MSLLLLCGSAFGQGIKLTVKPLIRGGAMFTTGEQTEFGFFAGGNINIYKGDDFISYTQVGKFFYKKQEDRLERNIFFLCIEKRFTEFKGSFKPYIAMGTGYIDEGNSAYMLDVGGVIYQQIGLSLGSWYAPTLGEVYISLNINLTP